MIAERNVFLEKSKHARIVECFILNRVKRIGIRVVLFQIYKGETEPYKTTPSLL